MGGAFIVFTLDRVARNRIAPPPFKIAECQICGKKTYARDNEKEVICHRCREDISKGILKEKAKS
jgi:ribosomal protein L37AE/L43A